MFWDLDGDLERSAAAAALSSKSPNGRSGLAVLYVVLLRFCMDSSRAVCKAWSLSIMGRDVTSVMFACFLSRWCVDNSVYYFHNTRSQHDAAIRALLIIKDCAGTRMHYAMRRNAGSSNHARIFELPDQLLDPNMRTYAELERIAHTKLISK